MQKQSGACAFSNACAFPGPRIRLEGTNRLYCAFHDQVIHAPAAASQESGLSMAIMRPRRRSRWLEATFGS